jgi:hypothetical protein
MSLTSSNVLSHQSCIVKLVFKIGMALADQWCLHLARSGWSEGFQFIDCAARRVADDRIDQVPGRNVDHACWRMSSKL